MISYEEAFKIIAEEFQKLELPTETVPLESSLNRTLAEDVIADVNLPPFDNSAVDGIAIKLNEKISTWKIVGEISAGNYSEIELKDDEAVRIMTGAKVPDNCDTVIPLEDYIVVNESATLNEGVRLKRGMNIRPKASDVKQGEIVVPKNSFISPRNISAIASCGKSEIKVLKKMKFAILATGDELIPVNAKPSGDKLRVSNNYGLAAAVVDTAQEAVNYGFVNDDYDATFNTIKQMFESDADVIITTGGVSVGKYDFVKDIFLKLGVEELFWRAYIKPGKPVFFGSYKKDGVKKLVFGLPGNPVSCMVNFDVYIKPNIINKYGIPEQVRVKAELLNDVRKKDGKRHFIRAKLSNENGKYFVTSQLSQSSGNLAGLSRANCLIVVDEETLNPRKGDLVECIMI